MKHLANPFLVYGYESPAYFCDRELIYYSPSDYHVYDRFFAMWLRRKFGR